MRSVSLKQYLKPPHLETRAFFYFWPGRIVLRDALESSPRERFALRRDKQKKYKSMARHGMMGNAAQAVALVEGKRVWIICQ